MKVTPWEEARYAALDAAEAAHTEHEEHDGCVQIAVLAALTTLSRLGYRIVPKMATEEMQEAIMEAYARGLTAAHLINAATEAGDVLKERKRPTTTKLPPLSTLEG